MAHAPADVLQLPLGHRVHFAPVHPHSPSSGKVRPTISSANVFPDTAADEGHDLPSVTARFHAVVTIRPSKDLRMFFSSTAFSYSMIRRSQRTPLVRIRSTTRIRRQLTRR